MGEKEEREEKGFVVKDRRKISLDDEDKGAGAKPAAEAASEPREEQAKEDFKKASQAEQNRSRMALPEVTFSTFVFSLSSSALVHLGEIPDPGSQRVETDLPLAKQIIDTLGVLDEKTRGNLNPDEDNLMKSVLYDLRMRFVQKSDARKA
ncbi:MAG: DUF1844 domain-containing protein [Syntrophobacteraceae bacterium]